VADDLTLNAGSGGATLATDETAGALHYQRVKVTDGTADSTTHLEVHTADAVAGATPTGLVPLAIRRDADTSLVGATGDYTPLLLDANGFLKVEIFDGGDSLTVDAVSLPLPSGASTSAAQLPDGHNVTVDNGAAGAAVNIQDGGNTITVDGTVTADAGSGTFTVDGSGVTQPVSGTVTANAGTGTFTIAGAVTNGGTFATQATLQTGSNAIGKLAANSGVDIGDVDVLSVAAGTNLVGDVGISGARTSGGTTLYKNIDVDESEDQIKGAAGQVYWIHAITVATTPVYLKFYNVLAASVTVGTTVPDLTFPVPSAGTANGGGFTLSIPNGIAFSTAITIAATTGVADNDSGAPAANAVIVNLGYA